VFLHVSDLFPHTYGVFTYFQVLYNTFLISLQHICVFTCFPALYSTFLSCVQHTYGVFTYFQVFLHISRYLQHVSNFFTTHVCFYIFPGIYNTFLISLQHMCFYMFPGIYNTFLSCVQHVWCFYIFHNTFLRFLQHVCNKMFCKFGTFTFSNPFGLVHVLSS
jgi:hypothetical protein